MKKILQRGFTLVELLIVVTLIGILATAVLAAINPIEQINKARDTKIQTDFRNLSEAYQRILASNPDWDGFTTAAASGTGDDGLIDSEAEIVAFVNAIIELNELKSSVEKSLIYTQSGSGGLYEGITISLNTGGDYLETRYRPLSLAERDDCGINATTDTGEDDVCVWPDGTAEEITD